jgi:hypothetical protein
VEAQALEVDRKVERIVGESVRSGSNSGGQTFRTNMQKGKKGYLAWEHCILTSSFTTQLLLP